MFLKSLLLYQLRNVAKTIIVDVRILSIKAWSISSAPKTVSIRILFPIKTSIITSFLCQPTNKQEPIPNQQTKTRPTKLQVPYWHTAATCRPTQSTPTRSTFDLRSRLLFFYATTSIRWLRGSNCLFSEFSALRKNLRTAENSPHCGIILRTSENSPHFGKFSALRKILRTSENSPHFGKFSALRKILRTSENSPHFGKISALRKILRTSENSPHFGKFSALRNNSPHFGKICDPNCLHSSTS